MSRHEQRVDYMNTRERFQAVMDFRPFDRLPLLEWAGWWGVTTDRWREEGLPVERREVYADDRYAICAHFGLDIYKQEQFSALRNCPRGAGRQGRQAGILAAAGEYDIARSFMYPDTATVVDRELWSSWAGQQERGEVVLWFMLDGFFWLPREVLGVERHLHAFFDEPELIHRMNSELAEWNVKLVEEICSVCTPDFMTFAEDMAYNHGSMLSKEMFDEFMKPYYEQVVPALKEHGILAMIDSDGDVTAPTQWFEEAGLQGMLPLERQAGVDLATVRDALPEMRFIGHFDKMTMDKGEARIRAEFERLLPIAAKGGFLIGCDHQTPPNVSFEDYQLYISLFREYAEEAGRISRQADTADLHT